MSRTDGRRRPPKPRIEVSAPGASAQETAAIAAAIELFLAETTPAPAAALAGAWKRQAMLEAVGTGDHFDPWATPPGSPL